MKQIGFVGLGRMGGNMVKRLLRDSDIEVVGFDPSQDARKGIEEAGAGSAASLEELVGKLEAPRVVWVMVPAGEITESTVAKLAELMDEGDLVVDGGNSRWSDDKVRAENLAKKGVHYVDVGTSGGVWGLDVGYCMMAGGPKEGIDLVAPALDVLAPPEDETHGKGWEHVGDAGAGHFVKMVHNGIEYGMMQAYAEGFDIFDHSAYDLDLERISHLWMKGSVVRSWLLELLAGAFSKEGNELKSISPHTSDSGEGRWTIEAANELDVPTPVITGSLYARFYSRGNGDFTGRVLSALRNQFGGHEMQRIEGDDEQVHPDKT